MKTAQSLTIETLPRIPPLPAWINTERTETLDAAAFQSGAALAHLSSISIIADLPHGLWRDRLALAAAEVCTGVSGRRESAGTLRDALHLTKPGDDPGPAGRVFRQWSKTVARPISILNLYQTLENVSSERIKSCLSDTGTSPIERSAQAIKAILIDNPHDEIAALILADAVLAKSLAWSYVLPLVSLNMKTRDLHLQGHDLGLACHRAVLTGVGQALSLANELARGAARLRRAMPKLRAKGAAQAIDLFLSRDALAPAALAREIRGRLSDRAARRLCERLVELGALRELTGRDMFRLYGV
jgi:hypothetical protein